MAFIETPIVGMMIQSDEPKYFSEGWLKSPTRFIVNIHPAILISMSDR
jgi:hypothetical protein